MQANATRTIAHSQRATEGLRHMVFDLDGTLIDSAPDLHAAVHLAHETLNRAPLDLATVTSFIGNGVETLVKRSLVATGGCTPDLHTQALDLFLRAYGADNATLTQLCPGVEACLTRLKANGVRLGLCTNKPQGPARDICQKLGLDRYFGAIHGARDTVAKKPDPASLLNCIAELQGAPDSTLYVGDSQVDQQTALNAGVDFALFTGGYLNGPLDGTAPVIRFNDWSQDWLGQS